MHQTMVDLCLCLDRVVPEGMCQAWRRSEVGNHKQRTLNTRLSSGTSEHTSSSSRNVPGRMIRSDLFWYWNKIKMKPTYRDKNLPFKGGPEPLEKNIHEVLGSKREDRFSNPFYELVQNMCQVCFSYLLRYGKLCKGPRTLRKFPQKCQKIAGC